MPITDVKRRGPERFTVKCCVTQTDEFTVSRPAPARLTVFRFGDERPVFLNQDDVREMATLLMEMVEDDALPAEMVEDDGDE